MRHSAIEFSRRLEAYRDLSFDALFCTDFLNLAEFKGLAPKEIGHLPTVAYFHENQMEYPNQVDDPRDLHFAFTNFTTGLAADQVWFNSAFNRDSLLDGLRRACRHWPDFAPRQEIDLLQAKSLIEPPGIDEASEVTQTSRGCPIFC